VWVYVLAGTDIGLGRIHFKMLMFLGASNEPLMYSKTLVHEYTIAVMFSLTPPWTYIDQVFIRNSITTVFGFSPYCGLVQRLKWYGGLYVEDNSLNFDIYSNPIMIWPGSDGSNNPSLAKNIMQS
jgi:hypothetical protein